MSIEPSVRIVELNATEFREAAELISVSMASNPVNEAAFKYANDAIAKQQKMFEFILSQKEKKIYGARVNKELVGVMCYTSSEYCQLKPLDMIRVIPKMSRILGSNLFRVLKWQKKWSEHDFHKPHCHFGPLAVKPGLQGKGIGTNLLTAFCRYLDETSQIGYLETDKEINVALYQKFGFKVLEEDTVLGVRNWFMVREQS